MADSTGLMMRGYVANTDFDWFSFLATKGFDEVNFWQPSGASEFKAIPPGAPFFFRLKSPYRMIAGFGYLSRQSILPDWLAWDTFREANGAATFQEMQSRIKKYRQRLNRSDRDKIGCRMILNPVFWPRERWIPEPADFSPYTVTGKTYDLSLGEGQRILRESGISGSESILSSVPRYGDPMTVRPRLGQGSFRIAVMDAYGSACAVTTEHSLPVLEAAHIKAYSDGGEHAISNGILLRSDIHRLFDKGYVTVSEDYRFEVSKRLREDFENGKSYYSLHGQLVNLPRTESDRPAHEMLAWHNANRYRG